MMFKIFVGICLIALGVWVDQLGKWKWLVVSIIIVLYIIDAVLENRRDNKRESDNIVALSTLQATADSTKSELSNIKTALNEQGLQYDSETNSITNFSGTAGIIMQGSDRNNITATIIQGSKDQESPAKKK